MGEDHAAPPGLRETEIRLRNAMCDESSIDLDVHARHIAVEVVAARRKSEARKRAEAAALVDAQMAQVRARMSAARDRLARRRPA